MASGRAGRDRALDSAPAIPGSQRSRSDSPGWPARPRGRAVAGERCGCRPDLVRTPFRALAEARALADSRHLSLTDELTGLTNRRRLIADLTAVCAQAERRRLVLLALAAGGDRRAAALRRPPVSTPRSWAPFVTAAHAQAAMPEPGIFLSRR